MKKYAALLAAAALTATISMSAFAAAGTTQLKDIDNYWGKDAVQYFYDNHYVNGVNGSFYPDKAVTREGVASIISNMIGNDAKAKSAFSDVKGRWSENAISSLCEKGIMNGYNNGTFKPEQNVTREEFAVIAYNYLNYRGVTTGTVVDTSYVDENQIAPWAQKAVDALAAAGYMEGTNNVFHPKDNVTRGEAVSVLYRILKGTQADNAAKTKVENQVFSDITTVYGSVKSFAGDGIMYWQANKLHVGAKTSKKRDKLTTAIAADAALPVDTVYVQKSKYSYNEYKAMMTQAEKIYRATEPADAKVSTDVDYLNEKIVLTCSSITPETQQALNKALGNTVKIVIQ